MKKEPIKISLPVYAKCEIREGNYILKKLILAKKVSDEIERKQ